LQALAAVDQLRLESVGPRPRPTILEFTTTDADPDQIQNRAATLAGTHENVAPAWVRIARRQTMRDGFSKQVTAIATALESRSRPIFPAGLEALASPTTPSSVVERCWLSGSMRTYVDPRALRDIAEERTLARLDLPRALRADIDGTASRVGAPQFRARFNVTGAHITVAVIDTEVDLNHPAFGGRVIQKVNYTKERWGSPNSHGTAVAGIIGSQDQTFAGIAPGVTITNYKVLATDTSLNGDDFSGALAIQQALEDGAQIA
jgi:serine protease AprX